MKGLLAVLVLALLSACFAQVTVESSSGGTVVVIGSTGSNSGSSGTGVVAAWGDWHACSVRCGNGTTYRDCLVNGQITGQNELCEGDVTQPCETGVPCSPCEWNDATSLNFALAWENFLQAYYKAGVNNFTLEDYEHAGYNASAYTYVLFLSDQAGSFASYFRRLIDEQRVQEPLAQCTYDFGSMQVTEFMALAGVFERVGARFYANNVQTVDTLAELLKQIPLNQLEGAANTLGGLIGGFAIANGASQDQVQDVADQINGVVQNISDVAVNLPNVLSTLTYRDALNAISAAKANNYAFFRSVDDTLASYGYIDSLNGELNMTGAFILAERLMQNYTVTCPVSTRLPVILDRYCKNPYWSAWHACTVRCGGGTTYRDCLSDNTADGRPVIIDKEYCANLGEYEMACNTEPCSDAGTGAATGGASGAASGSA